MIYLNVSNYNAPYDYLNGERTLPINTFDVARAMISTGRGSWSEVFASGIFRIGELFCKALAFSKIDNEILIMENNFFTLNQSEKATVTYYFGQSLTKLYAEKELEIPWVFHVDDYFNFIQFSTQGIAAAKTNIGNSTRNPERPDLLGFKNQNESHFFEAKGSSYGYNLGIMQHAINQVSQVLSYNGVPPETRAACYFSLTANRLTGRIIDPENDGKGIEFKVNEEAILHSYYSFFIKNYVGFNKVKKINGFDFFCTQIAAPNIYFGFDKRILEYNASKILSDGFNYDHSFKFFQKKAISNSNDFKELSLGLDGLILFQEN